MLSAWLKRGRAAAVAENVSTTTNDDTASDPRPHQERPRRSKQAVVEAMYHLGDMEPMPLGPGSKEHRSALVALAGPVGVDASLYPGKVSLAAAIAHVVEVPWLPTYSSAGETITLDGLTALLDGVNRWVGDHSASRITTDSPRVASQDHVPHTTRQAGLSTMTDSNESTGRSTAEDASTPFDEQSALERSLAESLAALSQAPDAPNELRDRGPAFDVDMVDFQGSSWRARLLDVEGWLRLPNPLDASSPQAFARTLADGLGGDDSQAPLVTPDGLKLTSVGFDRLRVRLDHAQAMQQLFQDTLEEEGGTSAAATAAWLGAWEDNQADDEFEGGGSILAKSGVWPISTLRTHARKGRLNLTPSYQRGDVWPTADAQLLMESILRGIPLPSIILLRQEEDGVSTYEVVDGKQRLTSMLRFIGAHPRAIARVSDAADRYGAPELKRLFEEDYPAFKRQWKHITGQNLTATTEREYFFPFPLRSNVRPLSGPLEPLQGKYYSQIRDAHVRVAGEAGDVSDLFEGTPEYKLPVIEYSEAEPHQIHEVFNLYNKQGKHLNAEEIRNALYQELDLMRALLVAAGDIEDIDHAAPFLRERWEDIGTTPEILRQYDFGTARFKRTKLLSWVASVVFHEPVTGGFKSTAGQINALLDRVKANRRDPLRDRGQITNAITLMDKGLDAHAAIEEAWAPSFVNNKRTGKWQELQLVASLVGVIGARAVLGEDLESKLAGAATVLAARTGTDWERPSKTQTAAQWDYVADVATGILEALGLDPLEVDEAVRREFGFSGFRALAERSRHHVG